MSSVGKITLDMNLNSKEFKKQVNNIDKQTTKAFGMMSVAVGNIVSNMLQSAVSGFGNFVKDSIDKGSELSELQNVVDSVYTTMSEQVNQFSKDALESYGLVEAQAKKMMGTFGAMSKSFGFAEQQAYSMSAALTGLAGDVASFYNLSVDEAYTKLKSVYTGETESLKELGVVMTQTALDEFALAEGFGKTTQSMSEQEKVALRLAFVQDKLSTAAGDFTKTQKQWANQTRILTGQFESFKAALGQGLINILSPVLRVINTIMAKLVQLANAFKSFTEMVMGVKSDSGAGSAMKEVADAASSAQDATDGMSDATKKVATNAAKAQKSLMGFDEINKLSSSSNTGSDAGVSDTASSMFDDIDFEGAIKEQEAKSETYLTKMLEKANEIVGVFRDGFNIGLGEGFEESISNIATHSKNIKDNFSAVFTDPNVVKSANDFVSSLAFSLGQVVGSITSVGITIGELILGGFDKFLSENKETVRTRLIEIFSASGGVLEAIGSLTTVIASIFEVFRGDSAKGIVSDIIAIFTNATLGAASLALQLGKDILNAIIQPFKDNEGKIKEVLNKTLEPLSLITSTINTAITGTYQKILDMYEKDFKPAIEDISAGIGEILGTILDVYTKHVAPVLGNLAEGFKDLWDNHLKDVVDNIIDFLGSVVGLIGTLWKEVLSPFISWLIETIVPKLTPIIDWLGTTVLTAIGFISDSINGVILVAKGIVTFLTGVFKNDWGTAWEGIKTTFSGIWTTIKEMLNLPNVDVKATLKAVQDKTFTTAVNIWNGIKSKTSTLTAKAVESVKNGLKNIQTRWNSIKTKTSTLTAKALESTKNALKKIQDRWSAIKSKTSSLTAKVLSYDSIKSKLTKIRDLWDSLKSKTATFTAKLSDTFTAPLKNMWNSLAEKINDAIVTINKIPGVDIKGRLPMLAEGGYVRANQPQLAVIGDNKRHGEIVSPEDKMTEVFLGALSTFFGKLQEVGYNAGQKVEGVKDIIIPIYLDGTLLDEVIVTAQQRRLVRSGGTA